MEKMMSKRDVIVCRGIWYVMALLSLFGLSISLNLLWPPGESSSRFLRDGAVSATTSYAVTLIRYLFFTDPPSPSTFYKIFATCKEKTPQIVFSELAIFALLYSPIVYSLFMKKVLYFSLFTVSLFNGGIGLIQLSDKFRMEMRLALITLFSGWFFCLGGIYAALYEDQGVQFFIIFCLHLVFCPGIVMYNCRNVPLFASDLPT